MINLTGQNILVTGGSRGIGAATVELLAQLGANVALHYGRSRQEAEAIQEKYPDRISMFRADLTKPNEITRLWDQVTKKLGSVYTLVNNAGIALNSPLNEEEGKWLRDWDDTYTVNLKASAQLSRLALQHFQKQQTGGRLIFISSRAAHRGDTAEFMAYAASKAGISALAKSIARAYGKKGIKSFIIAPGFTQTAMAQDFIDEYGEDYVLNDLALSSLTQPKNIATWIAFLASGFGDHATGTTIDVNAGSYISS